MQATSTAIRQERTEQAVSEGAAAYAARAAQVGILRDAILQQGQPELHADSTTLCPHFRLRKGQVEGEYTEAQLHRHAAGMVIRFWVYGGRFEVKTRDLILLPCAKGYDVWLDTTGEPGGRLFPHEGKYSVAARLLLAAVAAGR